MVWIISRINFFRGSESRVVTAYTSSLRITNNNNPSRFHFRRRIAPPAAELQFNEINLCWRNSSFMLRQARSARVSICTSRPSSSAADSISFSSLFSLSQFAFLFTYLNSSAQANWKIVNSQIGLRHIGSNSQLSRSWTSFLSSCSPTSLRDILRHLFFVVSRDFLLFLPT